jgi:hypothetical protein
VGRIDGDATNLTLDELTELKNGKSIPTPPTPPKTLPPNVQPAPSQDIESLLQQILKLFLSNASNTGSPSTADSSNVAAVVLLSLIFLTLSQHSSVSVR